MTATKRRRPGSWRRLFSVLAILLGTAAGALGWWLGRVPVVAPPTLDLYGVDPAVRRAIESARATVVQSPRSAEAWGRLGMLLLSHEFALDAALTSLAQAERLDPQQPRWPYLQALPLLKTDTEAALAKLRRTVALCDCVPDAPRLQLAELLFQQGHPQEAAEQFERLLLQHPDHARAALGLARLAAEEGNGTEALRALSPTLTNEHTRRAAQLLAAQVEEQLGNASTAEQALQRAAALPPDVAWPDRFAEEVRQLRVGKQALLTRADQLLHQGRVNEARPLLEQLVRDYPDLAAAWLLLGMAGLRGQDFAAAEPALRKAVELGPDNARAPFYLGVVCFRQKKYAEAARYFQKAIALKADFDQAYVDLGHCLKEQGDEPGALAAFRMAINCKPGYAAAHLNLGALLLKRGQREEALVHLREAVRLNPTDKNAQKLLEWGQR